MKAPIRNKIFFSLLAVAISTILVICLLMWRAIGTGLNGYARRNQENLSLQLVEALKNSYQQTGNWSFLPAFYHYAPVSALEFAVYDPGGHIIFNSREYQLSCHGMESYANVLIRGDTQVYDLVVASTKIGSVAITPLGLDGLLSAQDLFFRTTLLQSLLRAAIVAALAAIPLSQFWSGRIIRQRCLSCRSIPQQHRGRCRN